MGQEITVDTSMMSRDIDVLQRFLGEIRNDMGRMYDAVHVLDSMWEGSANQAFNQQFSKDRSDMEEMCNTIQKIIECMEYANGEYNSCDFSVTGIISSIRI